MGKRLSMLIMTTILLQGILVASLYAEKGAAPQKTVEKEGVIPHAMDVAAFEKSYENKEALIDEMNALESGSEGLKKESLLLNNKDPHLMKISKDNSNLIDLPQRNINEKPQVKPVDKDNLKPNSPEVTESTYPIYANPAHDPNKDVGNGVGPNEKSSNGATVFGTGSVIKVDLQEDVEEEKPRKKNKRYLTRAMRRELEAWGLGSAWTIEVRDRDSSKKNKDN